MEVYQSLELISKDSIEITNLLNDIQSNCKNSSWVLRNDLKDKYLFGMPNQNMEIIVLNTSISHTSSVITANLYFGENRNSLKVFNIVPESKNKLSYSEYNEILKSFYDELISPVMVNYSFVEKYTTAELNIYSILDKAVSDSLNTFINTSNKETGNNHPSDKKKWNEFVCLSHRHKSNLDISILERWLVEIESYDVEVASELVNEYENSLELLEYYDSNFNKNQISTN